ncbi:HD domain-containing protein [Sulfolobus acidocaldarius]|uniref:Conserved HD domain protein n=3 Tax=Sulfolobus acidocaldarius TaxID=2285 RepID=Q4J764_SULAC|nr:HD domain-containing protein [Sulfolobus acidocaldarius]AAY81368.1 conserved HD domain protein [Sulfolobus acidocaldarius DSM 639]AGE74282.1 HD domain-containing protein [Sulfolobus acidocaldarius Ron12/I]ALU29835.1 phosphohydrolase [Sulfolobus acidocaldarius]ALU32574.1 phosphohydrolase [Sulfolobus acidocaldarius]WCM35869.1 HD domain-containing protein [Sulfolobus acidocaldarius DSM 639]
MVKLIRDPIYGYIRVNDEDLRIVDSPFFQRLRYIRQNGMAYLVFPSATHSRFEHSLGVYHVADLMFNRIKDVNEETVTRENIRRLALVHDIGHLPFSHTFEFALKYIEYMDNGIYSTFRNEFFKEVKVAKLHELVGIHVIQKCMNNDDLSRWMKRVYVENSEDTKTIKAILNSSLDADRLDYLQRDSYYFGVKYGQIPLDRILETVEIRGSDGKYVFNIKGRDDLEEYLMARYHMYSAIYNHPVVGIFNSVMAYTIAKMMMDQIITVDNIKECDQFLGFTDNFIISKLHEIRDRSETYSRLYETLYKRVKYRKKVLEYDQANFFSMAMNDRDRERELYNFIKDVKGKVLVYSADVSMPTDNIVLSLGNNVFIDLEKHDDASRYINIPSLRRKVIIGYYDDKSYQKFSEQFLPKQ